VHHGFSLPHRQEWGRRSLPMCWPSPMRTEGRIPYGPGDRTTPTRMTMAS
jgi:hypothetical protein